MSHWALLNNCPPSKINYCEKVWNRSNWYFFINNPDFFNVKNDYEIGFGKSMQIRNMYMSHVIYMLGLLGATTWMKGRTWERVQKSDRTNFGRSTYHMIYILVQSLLGLHALLRANQDVQSFQVTTICHELMNQHLAHKTSGSSHEYTPASVKFGNTHFFIIRHCDVFQSKIFPITLMWVTFRPCWRQKNIHILILKDW